MKASLFLVCLAASACVMDQHLGEASSAPDADLNPRGAEGGPPDVEKADARPDTAIDAGIVVALPDVATDAGIVVTTPDVANDTGIVVPKPDVTTDTGVITKADAIADSHSSSTSSASCSTSCYCDNADTCRLECTGAPGCAATCGASRTCAVRLLGSNNFGDCRSAASCDVTCSSSCAVDCGSSRCTVACARGQPCAVRCGNGFPMLCPDGVTVVCNGRDC